MSEKVCSNWMNWRYLQSRMCCFFFLEKKTRCHGLASETPETPPSVFTTSTCLGQFLIDVSQTSIVPCLRKETFLIILSVSSHFALTMKKISFFLNFYKTFIHNFTQEIEEGHPVWADQKSGLGITVVLWLWSRLVCWMICLWIYFIFLAS